ncbi:LysR family transcriptional regulator [Rhodococcus erythropolis]|uniref:LysR family transcriptional regulator n=1 Tax=Rhodococcus erythropolis TaxID=1833 RepID=UPI00210E117E|nr:LysR family transcriptional regulator [Rhodococcus erythropolis]MCQ4129057.1 LysR family transcriptional regulator [Rhodococcus erythropolis]
MTDRSLQDVDLRLIEYFVAVAEHGTVTHAAQSLYVAQPSLSQAIRTLERKLGVVLFERSGRGLDLTADGKSLLTPARQILSDVQFAIDQVQAVRDVAGGRLKIVALSSLAIDPLAVLLSRFHPRFPEVILDIADADNFADVVESVREGRAELGLTELSEQLPPLHTRFVQEQEIALVLPPDLAATVPDPVPLLAAAALPLVVELSTNFRWAFIDSALADSLRNVVVECAHRQAVWELVRAGVGATVLPRRFAETELEGVVVRSFSPPITRSIGWVMRPGPLSPAAEAFLES